MQQTLLAILREPQSSILSPQFAFLCDRMSQNIRQMESVGTGSRALYLCNHDLMYHTNCESVRMVTASRRHQTRRKPYF